MGDQLYYKSRRNFWPFGGIGDIEKQKKSDLEKEQELQQKQFQEYESYKQMNNLSFLVDDLKQQNKDKQCTFLI